MTNGSLLNRKTVEALKTLGLESVKITLDGPAELHNSSRPYKSGAGTFDIIINHIKEICDLVKVNIGGNFEEGNYRRFPELLDVLIDEGLTPDRVGVVKFDPITAVNIRPKLWRSIRAAVPASTNPGWWRPGLCGRRFLPADTGPSSLSRLLHGGVGKLFYRQLGRRDLQMSGVCGQAAISDQGT